jgi:hypothetical protein
MVLWAVNRKGYGVHSRWNAAHRAGPVGLPARADDGVSDEDPAERTITGKGNLRRARVSAFV